MAALDVVVRFLGDSTRAVAAARETDAAYSRLSTNMKKTGLAMSGAITLPLLAAGKAAASELVSAEKVAAQTEAVIKSTGGAAGVTAKQVDELATSIQNKSGIDDEAIKSGENLLLTFTNVRNEAGKGNDVFNQATGLAADLSVAWGIDMSSAATKVGKALNDPIAGMSALSKVGVSFSAEQKETIKQLVSTGDVLGAQKVILKELQTEVGGSAAAYGDTLAGQVSKARESLLNAGASIIAVVAPAINVGAKAALEFATFLGSLPQGAQLAVGGLLLIVAALGPVITVFSNVERAVRGTHAIIETLSSAYQNFAVRAVVALEGVTAAEIAMGAAMTLGLAALVAAVAYIALSAGPYEKAAEAATAWGEQTKNAAKASGDSLGYFVAQQASLIASHDQLKAAQKEMSNAITEGQPGAQQQQAQLTATSQALLQVDANLRVVNGLVKEAKQAEIEHAVAVAADRVQLEELAVASQGVTGATNDQIASVQALSNTYLAAQGGALGYQAATLQVEAAQKRVDDLIANGSLPTSYEYRSAVNQLEQAKLNAAGAAMTMEAADQTLANTLHDKGVPGLVDFRDTLAAAEAKQHDVTGATQAQIDKVNALIAFLGGMPPDKTTSIHADTAQANRDLDETNAKADNAARARVLTISASLIGSAAAIVAHIPGFATGGVVPGPTGAPVLAVVHGGETIIPTSGAMSTGGSGGSVVAGGSVFNVNVAVSPGASSYEVGAVVVDQIRAYERGAGRAWRNG